MRTCTAPGCENETTHFKSARCSDHPSCDYVSPDGVECNRPFNAHGLCAQHRRQQRHGNPLTPIGAPKEPKPKVVKLCECGKPAKGRGMCVTHYEAWRRKNRPRPEPAPKPRAKKVEPSPEPYIPGTLAAKINHAQTKPRMSQQFHGSVGRTPPPDPEIVALARACLVRYGAEDLAEVLGVAA